MDNLNLPQIRAGNIGSASIPQEEYLKASQYFHWATKEHFILWLTGSLKRHRRTEVMLPRLAKRYELNRERSLFATKYGKRLVYSCPRKIRNSQHILRIEHGLGCTEVLTRFYISYKNVEVIEEREFRGCGCIPESGLIYPNRTMFLFEFSTEHDFMYSNRINSKLLAYKNNLWKINERFKAQGVVIFVIDVQRERIEKYLKDAPKVPAYFTDYDSFKKVPIGQQLTAPIYLWEGVSYPLSHD